VIPILYESTETEFTSNGLGRLSDAISCIVEEERNGAYELTMEYPIHGVHYKDLQNMRVISAVPSDGKERQPFDIYDISRPISGKVTVKARHISYRLSRIPTYSKNPDETSGTAALALQRLKSEALESCPFEFWTDQDSRGSYSTPAPASIRSRLGGVTGSILDCFGGEYEWDGWTVKLWKARGSETSVVLRYGKNITDITQEESIESTVTGVLPYWHKDAESDTAAQTVVGSIVYAENADKYPYHMTMVLDCSQDFQTAPTTGQLAAKAQTYIKANNIGVPDVSITLSFVALWQSEEYKALAVLERVHLCDTLRVEFPALGVSATAKVVKTTYNVLKDRYDSIEIGNARTNLADQITGTSRDTEIRQKQSLSFLQEALARSTKLIQGGLGGHVIINTDGDGKPNELLIMDTDDTKTASKVLQINMNGIGFSTKGYEGPFSTAWTIDGVFNADFINAGTIRANLIKTGLLQDQKGNNYWNLDTGEFRLRSVAVADDWNSVLEELHKYSDDAADTARKDAEERAEVLAKNASDLANAAQKTADKKVTTYYSDATPTDTTLSVGDLWIDTGNSNNLHRWDGSTWTNVADTGIQAALKAANSAQATADGKIVTYAQTSAPDAVSNRLAVGDLWLDTDDNNHPYRWNGSSWVECRDGFIQEAASEAQKQAEKAASDALYKFSQAVQQEVDKKVQVFYAATAPTSDMDTGDLWLDTDDNKMYRYNGSSWVSVQDSQIQAALKAANSAQATADTKIVCTASATTPTGATDGDLWIQTSDKTNSDGSIKTYSGSIWRYSTSDKKWHTWFDTRADALANTAESNAKAYADSQDSALNTTIMNSLTQQEIFNRLTNGGAEQGIYLENGKLYINGTYLKTGTLDADLIRTGTLKVGGTEKVDQMLLYDSYNKQSGHIGSDGIYVTGKWINTDKDPDVYIDMRAQLIGGMAISAAADKKGKCCAFSEDEILVKNNDSTLSWGLNSNTTSMRYNGLWINGPNGVNDILIYLDAEWGLGVKSGLNKSGIVETKNYGTRALYCYEMASPTYGDIGEGEIGEDGSEYIQIDPVLSECILTDQYQVFLQPYGNGKCYIAERKSTYFVVSGEPGLKFGWEIKAKNRDYNMNRLSVFDYTRPEKDETDYAGKAVNHIEQITKERRQT